MGYSSAVQCLFCLFLQQHEVTKQAVQVQLNAPETYRSALGPGKWLDALLQRCSAA